MPFFQHDNEPTTAYMPCPGCHGARRKITIVLLAAAQEWICETGQHVIIMDRRGKEVTEVKYLGAQRPKDPDDWRARADWQRTESVDGQQIHPQSLAWHQGGDPTRDDNIKQRLTRHGYNWYPGDEGEGKKKGKKKGKGK